MPDQFIAVVAIGPHSREIHSKFLQRSVRSRFRAARLHIDLLVP